jgi:hypothetical protein
MSIKRSRRRRLGCILTPVLPALRRTFPLLAPLVAGLALLSLPNAASASPLMGVQVDGADTAAGAASQLEAVRNLHGKVVRIEVSWARLEPRQQGSYDAAALKAVDRIVDSAAARGIKVVMFVDRTPCWASTYAKKDCSAGTDSEINDFATTRYQPQKAEQVVPVSTFLVQRYGAKLAAYEVWNEPDQANEKYWAGPNKVVNYVALMKALYAPLKAANPALQVLGGSFVGANGAWLKAMYAAGAKGYYDGLAVHFYDLPLYSLKQTRAVQLANGDTTPMWLSEFGWTSCQGANGHTAGVDHPCVTQSTQASALADVFRAIAHTDWISSAVMYTLKDSDDAYQFGLISRRGARKPAYKSVRSVLAGASGALRRPTMALRRSGASVQVSGKGSLADAYVLRVYQGQTLRYRALIRVSRFGAYAVKLPAVLGTSGLRVRLTSDWSGRSVTRTR